MSKAVALYLEIIVVLGTPLFLMGASPFILAARPILLAIAGIYCVVILRYYRVTYKQAGLTTANLVPALIALLLPSLMTIAMITMLLMTVKQDTRLWLIGTDPLILSSISMRIMFYIFGSVPAQELLFRSYFTYRLEQVFENKMWISGLSIFVFMLAHVPFKSPIMLLVALMLGYVYIVNYLKYKNILAIIISHAFVGAVLILVRNFYLPYI